MHDVATFILSIFPLIGLLLTVRKIRLQARDIEQLRKRHSGQSAVLAGLQSQINTLNEKRGVAWIPPAARHDKQ